jgi:predicted MPP superfamily phosphohydrolase
LAHEPDIGLVAAGSFDLQISGHTHGGQVVVPFGVGPLILPTLGQKFAVGLHLYKNLLIYVSKGIGISPLPKPLVRFNCRPEVSVLRIVPLE